MANPNDYVDDATGEIMVEVFTQKKNGDHITRTDLVEVIVTP
ncbi:MAG: hypothetical protein ACYTGG_00555 [Planctomycetota bacterium]